METDLAYVKAKLAEVGHAGFEAVKKGSGVPVRTIKRIAYGETDAPSSVTVGKIAIHFRTRERRRK